MAQTLGPYRDEIYALLGDRNMLNHDVYPVLAWKANPKNRRRHNGIVPFRGNISLEIYSRLMNWVYHILLGAPHTQRPDWVWDGLLQHVMVIWLANNGQHNNNDASVSRIVGGEVYAHAWAELICKVPSIDMDVDSDMLERLEVRMFDESKAAGRAGNQQWGLSSGILQERWSPYDRGRSDGCRVISEQKHNEETEVCSYSLIVFV